MATKFGTPGGKVLGPDMKLSVDGPNIDKFPSTSAFKDYESFRQAWEKTSTNVSEVFCDTLLPVPVGFWMHYPGARVENVKRVRGVAALSPGNELWMQDLQISGDPFDFETTFPERGPKGEPLFVHDHCVERSPWYATLIPQRPSPYLYKSFEDYRCAMRDWLSQCMRNTDLIPHAKEMSQILNICPPDEESSPDSNWRAPLKPHDEFSLGQFRVLREPTNFDVISDGLSRLWKERSPTFVSPKIDMIEIHDRELLHLKAVYQTPSGNDFGSCDLTRCSDFLEINGEDVVRLLETSEENSRCYMYSVIVGICRLLDRGGERDRIMNDICTHIGVWYKLAVFMNEQLLKPEFVYKYESRSLASFRLPEDMEEKRKITLQFYERLLSLQYAEIWKRYYVETERSSSPGFQVVENRMKPLKDLVTGLIKTQSSDLAEFLNRASSTVPLPGERCREIVNLLKVMFTYLPDDDGRHGSLQEFLSSFDLVRFLLSLSQRDQVLLNDLMNTILRVDPGSSITSFVKKLLLNVSGEMFLDWNPSMLNVTIRFLEYDYWFCNRETSEEKTPSLHKDWPRISVEFFDSLIVTVIKEQREIYGQILSATCLYMLSGGCESVEEVLRHFIDHFKDITDPDTLICALSGFGSLLRLPDSSKFVAANPQVFSFLFEYLSFQKSAKVYQQVTAAAMDAICRLVAKDKDRDIHSRYRKWLLFANDRERTAEAKRCLDLVSRFLENVPDDLCYRALIFLLKISSEYKSLKALAQKNEVLDKLFAKGRTPVEKLMNRLKDMATKDKATFRHHYIVMRQIYVVLGEINKLQNN